VSVQRRLGCMDVGSEQVTYCSSAWISATPRSVHGITPPRVISCQSRIKWTQGRRREAKKGKVENDSLHSLRMLMVYLPTPGIIFMPFHSSSVLKYGCRQILDSEVCIFGVIDFGKRFVELCRLSGRRHHAAWESGGGLKRSLDAFGRLCGLVDGHAIGVILNSFYAAG
jgi:hypothetical protein